VQVCALTTSTFTRSLAERLQWTLYDCQLHVW